MEILLIYLWKNGTDSIALDYFGILGTLGYSISRGVGSEDISPLVSNIGLTDFENNTLNQTITKFG